MQAFSDLLEQLYYTAGTKAKRSLFCITLLLRQTPIVAGPLLLWQARSSLIFLSAIR